MIIPRKTKVYGSFYNPNKGDRSANMLPESTLKRSHNKNAVALAEADFTNLELYDTFDEYCVPKATREIIAQNFNAALPTDIQRRSLGYMLRRDSVALGAPSGTGKTLAYLLPVYMNMQKDRDVYQIPTRECRPRTILLLPTQELCAQVQRHCAAFNEAMGFHSVSFRGKPRSKRAWARMNRRGRLLMDVLVTTPRALRTQIESRRLFLDDIRYMVIDEADLLISRKHEFTANSILSRVRDRNLYEWLWPVQTQYIFVSSIVTSELNKTLASAFPQVRRITSPGLHLSTDSAMHRFVPIRKELHKFDFLCYLIKRAGYDENSVAAPISRVCDYAKASPEEASTALVQAEQQRNMIRMQRASAHASKGKRAIRPFRTKRVLIFFEKIETCTAIYHKLLSRGLPVGQINSMMPLKDRANVFAQWSDGKIPILCTTDLLASGVDANVDVVVNFTMPNHAVGYLRRAGRTARMGAKGLVISLFTKSQRTLVRATREALLKKRPLNDLSNWWAQYKPTYAEWKKRKRNSVTKKFVHLILRRSVPRHLERTYIQRRGTLKLPWHPETIAAHKGIPERQHARIEKRRHEIAHEARKDVLARRKKGSARFGHRKDTRFSKPIKGADPTREGGDRVRMQKQREQSPSIITESYRG